MHYRLSGTEQRDRNALEGETVRSPLHDSGPRKSEPLRMELPLLQLYFYISEGCNLSCRHCWVPSSPSANGKVHHFLPFDIFHQAVEEARPLGLQSVRISGAFPLMHPDLYAMLDQIEQLELNLVIEANGAGMTPELARRLARFPQVSVSVGLDGANAAVHDGLHGMPGAFATATRTLRLLAEAGLAPEIIFTVLRRNVGQTAELVRLAEDLGASTVRINIPQPQPGDQASDVLQVEELIALGRRVERALAANARLRLIFDQPPAFRGLQPQACIEGQGRCGVLNILSVLSTGEYALCGLSQEVPELVFGRVGADPLAQVWKGHPAIQKLRDGMPEKLEGICDRCIMKTSCMGNCAAENYIRTGSFWSPYWFCEAADRAGLFPAGRLIENLW